MTVHEISQNATVNEINNGANISYTLTARGKTIQLTADDTILVTENITVTMPESMFAGIAEDKDKKLFSSTQADIRHDADNYKNNGRSLASDQFPDGFITAQPHATVIINYGKEEFILKGDTTEDTRTVNERLAAAPKPIMQKLLREKIVEKFGLRPNPDGSIPGDEASRFARLINSELAQYGPIIKKEEELGRLATLDLNFNGKLDESDVKKLKELIGGNYDKLYLDRIADVAPSKAPRVSSPLPIGFSGNAIDENGEVFNIAKLEKELREKIAADHQRNQETLAKEDPVRLATEAEIEAHNAAIKTRGPFDDLSTFDEKQRLMAGVETAANTLKNAGVAATFLPANNNQPNKSPITQEEIIAFSEMSEVEVTAYRNENPKKYEDIRKALDGNHDGTVTLEEATAKFITREALRDRSKPDYKPNIVMSSIDYKELEIEQKNQGDVQSILDHIKEQNSGKTIVNMENAVKNLGAFSPTSLPAGVGKTEHGK